MPSSAQATPGRAGWAAGQRLPERMIPRSVSRIKRTVGAEAPAPAPVATVAGGGAGLLDRLIGQGGSSSSEVVVVRPARADAPHSTPAHRARGTPGAPPSPRARPAGPPPADHARAPLTPAHAPCAQGPDPVPRTLGRLTEIDRSRLQTFNFQVATKAAERTDTDATALAPEQLNKYVHTVLRFVPVEVDPILSA